MWIFLTEKAALTYNRQIEYFKWLCESLQVEELLKLNKDRAFEQFFEENEDIAYAFVNGLAAGKDEKNKENRR